MRLTGHCPLFEQEEFTDRSRRPTKLSMEYHLHTRGSKSQTFSLPPSRPRHPVLPPCDVSQETSPFIQADDSGDIPGLPPATTLVEIALTPFKSYARDGPSIGRQEGRQHRGESPPVIKLNVALLGFSTVGKPAANGVAAGLGQRTLSGMTWLGRDSISAVVTGHDNPSSENMGEASGSRISPIRPTRPVATESVVSLSASTASPAAGLSAGSVRSPVPRAISAVSPPLQQLGEVRRKAPQVTENSVLVRCPICKACLPVGDGWDAHREEHWALENKAKLMIKSPGRRQVSPLPGSRIPERQTAIALQEQHTMSRRNVLHVAEERTRHNPIMISPSRYVGGSSDANEASRPSLLFGVDELRERDENGGQRSKLSELLRVAIMPEQAAQILRDHGLLQAGGQTRFANLFPDAREDVE